ncbi:MAG: hypothetical protein E5W65_10865 [Mesorhizobium sp.]|uniref:hypothetical protein n=1 Tax=Mesorhizobium sp. TaxID=1871066 RepID=UPI0011FE7D0A|nr:hypothetical protein [Mesorhizobium sp.]TIT36009.1 MAG: hypothetical protein E5W65_10865 [Mesorhizobium sp.]
MSQDDAWAIWHDPTNIFSSYVEGTIVPKAFLPAIGFVIVAFSQLDRQLDLSIAHLLGADRDTGRAITASAIHYQPRIDLLKRLIELRVADDADKRKLGKIAEKISSVAQKRHRLIHDYVGKLTQSITIPPSGPTLNFSRKDTAKDTEFTEQSLQELGSQMLDLAYRLQRFTKADPRWSEGKSFPWREARR